jgi:hypothetical protein
MDCRPNPTSPRSSGYGVCNYPSDPTLNEGNVISENNKSCVPILEYPELHLASDRCPLLKLTSEKREIIEMIASQVHSACMSEEQLQCCNEACILRYAITTKWIISDA